jgi:hypothetical protein
MQARVVSIAFLVILAGLTGTGVGADKEPEEKLPKILTAKPFKPGPKDDELRRLLIERYNSAVTEMQGRHQEFLVGKGTLEIFAVVGKRLVDSGLELNEKQADKVSLLEQYLELMREVEKINASLFEAGRISKADLALARYLRIDAEIKLLRIQRQANSPKP